MPQTINTNLVSLNAQRNLSMSQSACHLDAAPGLGSSVTAQGRRCRRSIAEQHEHARCRAWQGRRASQRRDLAGLTAKVHGKVGELFQAMLEGRARPTAPTRPKTVQPGHRVRNGPGEATVRWRHAVNGRSSWHDAARREDGANKQQEIAQIHGRCLDGRRTAPTSPGVGHRWHPGTDRGARIRHHDRASHDRAIDDAIRPGQRPAPTSARCRTVQNVVPPDAGGGNQAAERAGHGSDYVGTVEPVAASIPQSRKRDGAQAT